MSAINPKELQKFHDLWAPMIAALPAVINAAERSAELERHIAIKEAEFIKIDEACVQREAAAEASVSAARERTAQAKANHALELAALEAEAKEARASVRKAKADAAAKVAEHQAGAVAAAQATEVARKEHLAALAALEGQRAAQMASIAVEVKALEAKRDEVQAVIESLRKQLLG